MRGIELSSRERDAEGLRNSLNSSSNNTVRRGRISERWTTSTSLNTNNQEENKQDIIYSTVTTTASGYGCGAM